MWLALVAAAFALDDTESLPPEGSRGARAGHVLSVIGEVVALAAPPLVAAGTAGATVGVVRDPAAPIASPWNGLLYTGLALGAVGAPLTIAGAEMEASGRRKMGHTVSSHGDVAAWASFGVAVTTLVASVPVAASMAQDNPSAARIVTGSAGVVGTTLWFCSVGLGAGYRGSLRREAGRLTLVPTGSGAMLATTF